MRTKRFRVTLTSAERDELKQLISSGAAPARKLAHARILLKVDSPPSESGPFDAEIAAAGEVSVNTACRVRQRFVEEGLTAALAPRPSTQAHPTKLDGRGEARLIAEAYSPPPGGQGRWKLRLLADRLVELDIAETIAYETVRRTLKKRHQAVADHALAPASPGQRRVRGADGGRAGRVRTARRRALPPGLSG